jgi:hypothetical protein
MFMARFYFTHLAPHTLCPFEQHPSAADAHKKFLSHNVRKNNRITSFVSFDLSPKLASSPPSASKHRSLALKIREPLQEANAQCGAGVELGVPFI